MTFGRISLSTDTLRPFQRVVDLLLILLAHSLALILSAPVGVSAAISGGGMNFALLFGLLSFTMASTLIPVYLPRHKESLFAEVKPVLLAWSFAALAMNAVLWSSFEGGTSALTVSVKWPLLAAALLAGWRVLERPILRSMWSHTDWRCSVAILGATASAYRLCQQIAERPWLRIRVVGVYDDRGPDRRHALYPGFDYRGNVEELMQACAAGTVEAAYIALPLAAEKRVDQLRQRLAATAATAFVVADLLPTYDPLGSRWTAIGASALISVHDTPFRGPYAIVKRTEDVLAGILGTLLLIVPMAAIAILIKATSRGPVFFRQRRYGLDGEEIRILKFRTMSVCEDGDSIQQAKRNDSRVTKVGGFLRRISLDELPQFLQVLTGCMSLVGPRPHAVAHNERYRAVIPRYMLRHKVKPGITGWAQVNGWRGETPTDAWMEKRIEHDLEYINNWSLLLDVKIVLLTIFGRASRRNAF